MRSRPIADGLPPLPNTVKTRDGATFDPRPDVWRVPTLLLGTGVTDFTTLEAFTSTAIHKLKLALIRYVEANSYAHYKNLTERLLEFYRRTIANEVNIDSLSLGHITSYRAGLTRATEWKLATLRILLCNMDDWGYGICNDDAVQYLRDATIKGNIKGTAVRVRDPEKGAFSDIELLSIQSALNDAYAEGRIELPEYSMVWLFLAYGARPIQIASLKECDLHISLDGNEGRFYTLRMPRAKQRGNSHRDSFKSRHCGKQLGELLELLREHNRSTRPHVDDMPEGSWPMFVAPTAGAMPGFKYHYSSSALGAVIQATINREVRIKANPRRFRITLAQRAVDDGKDQYTVAELLDHSDTQNVKVYYEASPATVERLDRHLAMELAPLAQAFTGHLVGSEDQAQRGADPMSRIYDKTLQNNVDRPLGTCGQMSFCGLHAPVACYTCRHFQPWLDAPHEEYLQALTDERERMIADGYSSKIYSIKDRTILAVAEVIQLCEAGRETTGEAQ